MPMRPCLKSPLPSPCPSPSPSSPYPPSSGSSTPRKCAHVAFTPAPPLIHYADEWDRTPAPPHYPLTIQEVMELEAIQRSLPRANQPFDPYTGKRVGGGTTQFLTGVPVGLLPLLPDEGDAGRHSLSPQKDFFGSESTTPKATSPTTPTGTNVIGPLSSPISPNRSYHPPHLSHLLPPPPLMPRTRPVFEFVALLDSESNSPAQSRVVPGATPSSTVAIDAGESLKPTPNVSEPAPSSDVATVPPLAPLIPPSTNDITFATSASNPIPAYGIPPALKNPRLQALYSPSLAPVSPLVLGSGSSSPVGDDSAPLNSNGSKSTGYFPLQSRLTPQGSPAPEDPAGEDENILSTTPDLARRVRRTRKIMIIINDMELEVDEEFSGDEDELSQSTPSPPTRSRSPSPCGEDLDHEPPEPSSHSSYSGYSSASSTCFDSEADSEAQLTETETELEGLDDEQLGDEPPIVTPKHATYAAPAPAVCVSVDCSA